MIVSFEFPDAEEGFSGIDGHGRVMARYQAMSLLQMMVRRSCTWLLEAQPLGQWRMVERVEMVCRLVLNTESDFRGMEGEGRVGVFMQAVWGTWRVWRMSRAFWRQVF